MLSGNTYTRGKKEKGFTLFEMVVVICSIVILYMVAEQRLNEIPAAAERANFYGTLEQIKTGLTFEMATRLARNQRTELMQLEGTNPMDFFLEAPRNYRGELELVTDVNVTRRSWYFENTTGELVYVIGGPSIDDVLVSIAEVPVNLGQIRLKLVNVYSMGPGSKNGVQNGNLSYSLENWQGLLLQPVYPFEWVERSAQPVEI